MDRLAWLTVLLLALPGLAVTVLTALVGVTWMAELAVPWRPHVGLLLLVAAGIAAPRSRPIALALGVVGLLHTSAVASRVLPHTFPATTHALDLAVLNVHVDNVHAEAVLAWIRETNPDVVVLVELTPGLARELDALYERWPYAVVAPKEGFWGSGVWSRRPLRDLGPVDGVRAWAVQIQDGPRLAAVHLMPPEGPWGVTERARGLAALARYSQSVEGPLVIAGDMNLTPWSPHFKALLEDGGLTDLGAGQGVQATWPSALGILGIPIDHVLGSRGMSGSGRVVGEEVGSDHRGVVIRLGW